MQLVRIFTSLADTYGHILRIRLPEVDLSDVVLNRRILCVLLPALEKSPEELANLGKIIIATLKSMMAAGLGDSVEGEWKDLIDRKPTNAETPYLCILDEYGYYAVEGFAVVPAQARSLGFSVIFAGQDLPAFQKASKEEAASIGANTNIKICM
jgi:intracellular multiplication protein IcmO